MRTSAVACFGILVLCGCSTTLNRLLGVSDNWTEYSVQDSLTNREEVVQLTQAVSARYGLLDRTAAKRATWAADPMHIDGYEVVGDYETTADRSSKRISLSARAQH